MTVAVTVISDNRRPGGGEGGAGGARGGALGPAKCALPRRAGRKGALSRRAGRKGALSRRANLVGQESLQGAKTPRARVFSLPVSFPCQAEKAAEHPRSVCLECSARD